MQVSWPLQTSFLDFLACCPADVWKWWADGMGRVRCKVFNIKQPGGLCSRFVEHCLDSFLDANRHGGTLKKKSNTLSDDVSWLSQSLIFFTTCVCSQMISIEICLFVWQKAVKHWSNGLQHRKISFNRIARTNWAMPFCVTTGSEALKQWFATQEKLFQQDCGKQRVFWISCKSKLLQWLLLIFFCNAVAAKATVAQLCI